MPDPSIIHCPTRMAAPPDSRRLDIAARILCAEVQREGLQRSFSNPNVTLGWENLTVEQCLRIADKLIEAASK